MVAPNAELFKVVSRDVIQCLSPRDLLSYVRRIDDARILRLIADARFQTEARVMNDDPKEPFILWEAINKEPRQHWLPLVLGKVVRTDFQHKLTGNRQIIVPVPASASWYGATLRDNHLFRGAQFPLVLKDRQLEEMAIDPDSTRATASVHSYVHNRKLDGTRGTQNIHFFNPDVYRGADLILIDDALAHGLTALELGQFAKEELGVNQVFLGVPMAKELQGGIDRVLSSPHIDGLSVLVTVTGTHGKGQPIDYHVNGNGL